MTDAIVLGLSLGCNLHHLYEMNQIIVPLKIKGTEPREEGSKRRKNGSLPWANGC
jgi:hypothetical protein